MRHDRDHFVHLKPFHGNHNQVRNVGNACRICLLQLAGGAVRPQIAILGRHFGRFKPEEFYDGQTLQRVYKNSGIVLFDISGVAQTIIKYD